MKGMFVDASAFNQPVGGWDVGAVRNVSYMFRGAAAFGQLVSRWQLCAQMCPFDQQGERLWVAGEALAWHPSQGGRLIDQWLRAHDMVVTLRRSMRQSALSWKLPEELVRAVGQWLGVECIW
jgi:predicted flavoprotein YhiN